MCTQLEVGKPMIMNVHPKDDEVKLQHTFNATQIGRFKNGSALNSEAVYERKVLLLAFRLL